MRYGILRAMHALLVAAASLVIAPAAVAAPCAGFTDVENSSFFCANVGWLKNRAITLGCTSSTLYCPNDSVSRLAMAAFMNRLGTALTPVQLRVDVAPAAIDLDASPVVCQTSDFSTGDFERIAYADARFSGTATAAVGLAADLVMSLDAGASWSSLNLFSARGFVPANQWGTLAALGFANLDADQSARFGVRMSRLGAAGGADLTNSRCQLRVRIYNRDQPAVNAAPSVNAGTNQTITLPASANLAGTVTDDGLPNPPATVTLTWTRFSGPGVVTFGNANAAATSASFSAAGTYVLRLTASDGALSAFADVTIVVNAQGTLPPDPETVASAPEPGVVSDIGEDTRFLYTGSNPIQTGVAPGTIERVRAAVLRGKVRDRSGAGIGGVRVDVLDHPQFGQTLSRADGKFDLAINGGGVITLNYTKSGFLPAQRQVQVPWREFREVEDVVLVPLDARVTAIAMNAPAMQVHAANAVTDANGSRTSTLLVPASTTASLVMPDGSTQTVTSLNVRATEYTVGVDGPRAMPASLPAASGYTYAVELSADEAIAAGARTVQFNQPLINYVENFLGFPVGTAVPTGFYDRDKAAWIGSLNGRVIKITGNNAGLADVDSVGTGSLAPLSLSTAERQQLAQRYAVGQELWRVPVDHFTPWDHNWPYGPPSDAEAPDLTPPSNEDEINNPGCSSGSVIECENQTLGERVPLVGMPYALNYRSTRVPGRTAARTLSVELSGASVPASLKRIELDVQVAGRSFRQSVAPGANQRTSVAWDGLDAYGRPVQGAQSSTVRIGYVYDAVYQQPDALQTSFGAFGSGAIGANRARAEVTLSQVFTPSFGSFDARSIGLGGWTLSSHHVYDPAKAILHMGDGARLSAGRMGSVLRTISDNANTSDVVVGPDGSVYVAEDQNNTVRRFAPDGTVTIVAGAGHPNGSTFIQTPRALALGPDGSVYITESFVHRIRRVAPDGTVSVVAGTGVEGFSGDGGLARNATLSQPQGIVVAADGTIYIADTGNRRIRRIRTDGRINTVAGSGSAVCSATTAPCGDGGQARLAALQNPRGLALGPDGSLYLADTHINRVRRIAPDGIITTVVGSGLGGFAGDGGPATSARLRLPFDVDVGPDGSLYIADTFNGAVRHVTPGGVISTVAGNGVSTSPSVVEGRPATSVSFEEVRGVAVGPNGKVYLGDHGSNLVVELTSALPGVSLGDIAIPSPDGRTVFQFDSRGRHLRTLHALTGAAVREFGYDGAGRLASLVEKTGGVDNVTTIERDAQGNPTAIVAPFGQRTTLGIDANGFLSRITNPAGEAVLLTSAANGLLTQFTDPRGKSSTFTYDGDGRLTRDTDAVGGFQSLSRTAGASDFTVARATALARTTRYKVEDLAGNIEKRTLTAADGTQATSEDRFDLGSRTIVAPGGTVIDVVEGPDARFGMLSPLLASVGIAVPGGPTAALTTSQLVDTPDPLDPFAFTSVTSTATIGGHTTSSVFTAATRTEQTTTPAGRTAKLTIDSLGRPVRRELVGLHAAVASYDARGRLASISRGSGPETRTMQFAYDGQGFLQTITDPLGRTQQFTRDAAGRVTNKTLPDGRVVSFTYDAAGRVVGLTPPGRPAHTLTYSDRGQVTLVTPPPVAGTGPTSFAYNLDAQPTTSLRPDNRSITAAYDAFGRRTSRAFATSGVPSGTDTMSYDGAGRVASAASAGGVTTSYAYAGSLLTAESWSGPIAGSVSLAYDNEFRIASQSINGGNAVAFGYDPDGLLTSAGSLAIARDPQHGLATGTTLGVVGTTTAYNGFGEATGHTVVANSTPLYAAALTRDAMGRIVQKTETIGGATDTYVYAYDVAGQFVGVTRNGSAVESYAYDAAGNRISTLAGTATYDAQDRLLTHTTTTFSYTAAGELASRTSGGQTTTYQYDAVGNLLGVALPGGTSIGYVVDGRDRRVGKRVNGTLVQGFLYGDSLRPVAELDGTGAVVSRFVYAGRQVPAYMVKAGVSHRIVADALGSVRLVVNAATGAIVQRIDYDAFGNVTLDTNPGFQPFGYAGGLYDAATGLVRFGARDYDARVGRWTAKDPVGFAGNDSNLYRYARNDPVNFADPTGLESGIDIAVGIAAGIVDVLTMRVLTPAPYVDTSSLDDRTRYTVSTGNVITDWANIINFFTDEPVVDTGSFEYGAASFCTSAIGTGAAGLAGRAALAADAALAATQARNAARLAAGRSGQVDFAALGQAAAESRAVAAAQSTAQSALQRAHEFLRSMSSSGFRGGGGGSGIGGGGGW